MDQVKITQRSTVIAFLSYLPLPLLLLLFYDHFYFYYHFMFLMTLYVITSLR